MKKRVIIVGGGVAGMQTALQLKRNGIEPLIIERESSLGGKVKGWYMLFPSFTPAHEVIGQMTREVELAQIECRMSCEVVDLSARSVTLKGGEVLACDAVVVASGYTLFDAKIKEEYGYGIYDNVYTTPDVEQMFIDDKFPKDRSAPLRIALLHCVGSRDEKVCQGHCSKVCCITGVKQAIELKKKFPASEVFNFYMDIRMFGAGYEELYREAQIAHNIHFVRGRISEAAPTIDNRIQIKAEDTLTARPLKMSVDMLILIVGMRANDTNETFAASAGLQQQPSRFMKVVDHYLNNTSSSVEGIFYAGCVSAPKNIGDSLNDAMHAAEAVRSYLEKQ